VQILLRQVAVPLASTQVCCVLQGWAGKNPAPTASQARIAMFWQRELPCRQTSAWHAPFAQFSFSAQSP
jgi:hypothetical protein